MREGRARRRLAALAAGLLLMTLGQGGGPARAGDASPAVLRVGWAEEPDTLNPFRAVRTAADLVFRLTYERLVAYDETLRPAAGLAEDWQVSDEGRTWRFRLRGDATWHDGSPVTADDVRFTLDYVRQGGLDRYRPYVEAIERVETPDERTVTIRFQEPQGWMPFLDVPILPRAVWEGIPPAEARTAFEAEPPTVGSGPFRVVAWRRGEVLELEAQPGHWRGAPGASAIHFLAYPRGDAMVDALRAGALDAVTSVPPARFAELRADPAIAAIRAPGNGFWQVTYNTWADDARSEGHPALRDRAVRLALDHAIDRRAIVEEVLFGLAEPGDSVVPPYLGEWHWSPPDGVRREHDPDAAGRLLDEAGWRDRDGDGVRESPDGQTRLALRLFILSTNPESPLIAERLRAWWRDIGVETSVAAMDDEALQDRILAGDFDALVWGWGGEPDPSSFLSLFTSEQIGGWSDSYYSNPKYDELFRQQETTADRDRRRELVHRLQEMVYRDAPYSVLYYWSTLQAYRRDRFVLEDGETGQALFSPHQSVTLLRLRPAPAEAAGGPPRPGADWRQWWWGGAVLGAAALAALAATILRRRSARGA